MTLRLQGQVTTLKLTGGITNENINGGIGDTNLIGKVAGCCSSGSGSSSGVVLTIDNNWTLINDMYYKDLIHNLGVNKPSLTIVDDEDNITITHKVETINSTVLRLYVPVEPDCRFTGIATLIKP